MNKAEFFAATARPSTKVDVAGFGQVSISSLTLSQRMELNGKIKVDQGEAFAWIVAQGVDDLTVDDLESIRVMDSEMLQTLASEILELSGLGDDAVDDAKND